MSESRRDQLGFTVVELTVAMAILVAAVAGLMTILVSFQNTAAFQSERNRALDDLRVTAGAFSKDARHASRVTAYLPVDASGGSSISFETYVRGTLKIVTYRLVVDPTDSSKWNLERLADGGTRLFVIKLTSNSVFLPAPLPSADPTSIASIRRVQLHMETKPQVKHPAVVLATEVSLRNVT